MDVDAWFHVVLVVLLWGMIGYWSMKVRRIRRLERDAEEMRAQVAQNLARAERLVAELDRGPWAGLIDDPEPPVH